MLAAAGLQAPLPRGWIARHIPHEGDMCLIDAVVSWDARSIRCTSMTHLSPTNPLRAEGRLGAVCGVEYAAQAMAIHCALAVDTGDSQARPAGGMIAALHDVECHTDRLDGVPQALDIAATRESQLAGAASYQFTIHCAARLLLSGRVTLKLEGATP